MSLRSAAYLRAKEVGALFGVPGSHVAALAVAAASTGMALESWGTAFGQVPQTLNGPPVQVQPYVPEPGVSLITINPGSPNPLPIADAAASGGNDTGNGGDGGANAGNDSGDGGDVTTVGGSGNVGSNTALATMLGTAWGATAVANAQTLGVNPSALAATCVLESGCQNAGGSGAQGVFQMYPAAFNEGLQTALAANPSLALQIVQGNAGRMDPATEAIAASGYLIQAVQNLQGAGIVDPTVLQVRGYYNFGPAYGAQLAQASDNEPIASVLYGMSQSALSQNGIRPGETVGQWRATVSSKIGNAANQPVVTS
jgi:hypothetical protein